MIKNKLKNVGEVLVVRGSHRECIKAVTNNILCGFVSSFYLPWFCSKLFFAFSFVYIFIFIFLLGSRRVSSLLIKMPTFSQKYFSFISTSFFVSFVRVTKLERETKRGVCSALMPKWLLLLLLCTVCGCLLSQSKRKKWKMKTNLCINHC